MSLIFHFELNKIHKNSSFIIYQLYMCTNIVNIFVYLGYSNLVVMKKYKL